MNSNINESEKINFAHNFVRESWQILEKAKKNLIP